MPAPLLVFAISYQLPPPTPWELGSTHSLPDSPVIFPNTLLSISSFTSTSLWLSPTRTEQVEKLPPQHIPKMPLPSCLWLALS